MTILYDILRKPILTEKSNNARSSSRKITLEVLKDANKKQIKYAIKSAFNVDVRDVNTAIYRGKFKRVGKNIGKSSNWKKAVLTLASDSDLDAFGIWNQSSVSGENDKNS
jgi:large subunit ribosomal protein L23